jgi:cytochrome c oxidase subunit I+III
LSLSFFSAASMTVAIPSAIQVFSWIATIAAGRERFRITTPSLFVLGFLFIFAIGGLTGVMVAVAPFDFQAHDTYFVVAHFHYVLIGGMVFPLFATYYYWAPMVSRNMLSEKLGRWVFWLIFLGFNITFFPMHITGLLGMPRRVWTYPAGMGWDGLNLLSTVGSFMIAAGALLFVIDLVRRLRPGEPTPENPWNAGTLEWLVTDVYSTRTIPHVTSREPLWDQPNLYADVEAGRYYLPGAPTGGRETIVTSPIEGEPQYVIRMIGPGWAHFFAAVFTAACFLLLTIKLVWPALACFVLAILSCFVWVWELDREPLAEPVDIGGGIKLPTYVSGPMSHAWWAMVVLMLVAGSLYVTFVFSYLYIWTVAPQTYPPIGAPMPPAFEWPFASGALMVASIVAFKEADRFRPQPGAKNLLAPLLIFVGAACLLAGVGIESLGHWRAGLSATETSYGAMVYMASILNGELAFATALMAGYTLVRFILGKVDAVRRTTFECKALLSYYTAGQTLFGLALIHGFPHLIG